VRVEGTRMAMREDIEVCTYVISHWCWALRMSTRPHDNLEVEVLRLRLESTMMSAGLVCQLAHLMCQFVS